MAIVIDATVGGASSNSYVTLAEATTYFEGDYHSNVWDVAADDDARNQALVSATRRLNQEDYYGNREDVTTPQRLKFPRLGLGYLDGISLDSIIPLQLKDATYELAKYILSVDMSQPSVDTSAIQEAAVGSIKVKYVVDKFDNVSESFDTLPPYITALLSDLSRTISSGGFVSVGR